jgi:hypothetical protein
MSFERRKRPKWRERLPGGLGRSSKQYKLTSFSAEEMLQVLDHLAEHGRIESTIKHFYPTLASCKFDSRRVLILSWRRKREQVEGLYKQKGGAVKRKARQVGLGTISPIQQECQLVRWVNELREEGVPVSSTMLRRQGFHLLRRHRACRSTLNSAIDCHCPAKLVKVKSSRPS